MENLIMKPVTYISVYAILARVPFSLLRDWLAGNYLVKNTARRSVQ